MNDDGPNLDSLDDNLRDKLVAAGKAAAGFIPFVGGPLAEIVGAVVPGQRADRIAAYLHQLADRFSALEDHITSGIAASPPKVDLIEEGGFQAARALSDQRIRQIVHAVVEGISQSDADIIRRKRLLTLLGELDDDEVALLHAHGQSHKLGGRLRLRYSDAVDFLSPRENVDREHLFRAGRDHLLRLGLLRKRFPSVRVGQLPEFDANAGDFKHAIEVSHPGRILLRDIGLPTPIDAVHSDGC